MIVFFAPGGRIGNLFFQLQFIASIRKPGEWIVATQLRDVPERLGFTRRLIRSENKLLINLIDHLFYPLIYQLFVKTRLIHFYGDDPNGTFRHRKGLLPIALVSGYFQFAPRQVMLTVPRLENHELNPVTQLLDQAASLPKVFIHVRRTDYLQHRLGNQVGIDLPFAFYERVLRRYFGELQRYHFFLIGDDPKWAERMFRFLPNRTVSPLGPWQDLYLMSCCDGGILSNSTFAWWGANFCQKKLPVVAPRFWLGWKQRQWVPAKIGASWMVFEDVEA